MTSYAFPASDIWVNLPSRHLDVRMTWYKNFFVDFGFRIEKYPPSPNLSKIKPISWQICKFLHFSVQRHIHNKRLPWQHLRLMRIVIYVQNNPHKRKIKLEKFHFDILCRFGVIKESLPGRGESTPLGEIG